METMSDLARAALPTAFTKNAGSFSSSAVFRYSTIASSSQNRRRAPVYTITAQPNPERFVVSPILIEWEAVFASAAVHAFCDARSMAIHNRVSVGASQCLRKLYLS